MYKGAIETALLLTCAWEDICYLGFASWLLCAQHHPALSSVCFAVPTSAVFALHKTPSACQLGLTSPREPLPARLVPQGAQIPQAVPQQMNSVPCTEKEANSTQDCVNPTILPNYHICQWLAFAKH